MHMALRRIFDEDSACVIVAFDVDLEKFRLVSQPEFSDKNVLDMNLVVLGGCLCAIVAYKERRVEIWVMKEYGIKESWANLTSVSLVFDESNARLQLNPLAYSRSGDQVLQSHNNTRLSWYDLVKMEFRNVKVCGLPSWLYAGVCVESLVSLNGYGEESETDAFFLKNYKLVRLKKAQNVGHLLDQHAVSSDEGNMCNLIPLWPTSLGTSCFQQGATFYKQMF
ncbi:hypothetical protein RJ640_012225 [Escallonia rubra]|uniref:F-box associated beta-propeller type 3 domain-containing protein n=1 Tax=Escallonia rubra TaxID=112253 RepID=A0AA88RTA2_9ASTE|nr:hypothetical protein RJ640_012225 [Escallonia rubra]